MLATTRNLSNDESLANVLKIHRTRTKLVRSPGVDSKPFIATLIFLYPAWTSNLLLRKYKQMFNLCRLGITTQIMSNHKNLKLIISCFKTLLLQVVHGLYPFSLCTDFSRLLRCVHYSLIFYNLIKAWLFTFPYFNFKYMYIFLWLTFCDHWKFV